MSEKNEFIIGFIVVYILSTAFYFMLDEVDVRRDRGIAFLSRFLMFFSFGSGIPIYAVISNYCFVRLFDVEPPIVIPLVMGFLGYFSPFLLLHLFLVSFPDESQKARNKQQKEKELKQKEIDELNYYDPSKYDYSKFQRNRENTSHTKWKWSYWLNEHFMPLSLCFPK